LVDVRALLKLDLKYYDGSDVGLIAELSHRVKLIATKRVPDLGRQLRDALAKSKLLAFWVPQEKKVLIDSASPEPKHRWIEAHEVTHSIVPWHRDFLLGDNAETLDPACHAIIEAEANFGAGQLLFLQDRFVAEARDLELGFKSIGEIAKKYHNSMTSTLWRFVQDRQPECPCFGIISCHPRYPEIGAHEGSNPWRHFIRSAGFRAQFPNVQPQEAYALVARHASYRRRGPIVLADDLLQDANGEWWDIRIESFCNSHDLLTIGTVLQKHRVSYRVGA
jgi:hypothetical protein